MPTKQAPIGSGNGARTTARDVIGDLRLDGKIAIVTGGYTGIGLETTRVLAAAGAHVIAPARNLEKARAALNDMKNVEIDSLDLAESQSIEAFASRVLGSDRPVHILVNNAGIMATAFARDARGFESQLATNHVGHFDLTARLWPALVRAKGARVVALSSRGHMRSAFNFEDPNFEKRPYHKWHAYGQSKTANALFAIALDLRGESRGVRAFSVHPGAVLDTDLTRSLPPREAQEMIAAASKTPSGFKSIEEGAATSVWCATSSALNGMGGVYCEDCDVAQAVPNDFKEPLGVRAWACDLVAATKLWDLSERWTGQRLLDS